MPRQDEAIVNQRIQANREIGEHTCQVSGREFLVFPTVFSPKFNFSTHWASEIFPFPQPHESMLEIGTGCGALSIGAALAGCRYVTATDVNPIAVDCARENARRYKVNVQCLKSNLFESLNDRKFNMIFWNFPFNYPQQQDSAKHLDFCAQSFYDPGYHLLDRYLAEARFYLKPGGRLYMTFSPDTGNLERFKQLTGKHSWTPLLVNSTDCPSMSGSTVSFNLYQLIPCDQFQSYTSSDAETESTSGTSSVEYGSSVGSA